MKDEKFPSIEAAQQAREQATRARMRQIRTDRGEVTEH